MARPAKTESLPVCVDSDVLVAGVFSARGASHAVLVLGELGFLSLTVSSLSIEEVRRNLSAKMPAALPTFERLREGIPFRVHHPSPHELERARPLAHPKDAPVLAAAIGAGAPFLLTHNVRHFRSGEGVRVLRPGTFLSKVRAWMVSLPG